MRTRILAPVLTLSLAAGLAQAGPVLVETFEDAGPEGTVVDSGVIGNVNVGISASNGLPFDVRTFGSGIPAFNGLDNIVNEPSSRVLVSVSRFITTGTVNVGGGFNLARPITFTFDRPVHGFGLKTIDLMETGTTENETVSLTLFDAGDNVVRQVSRTGAQGDSGVVLDWFARVAEPVVVRAELGGNLFSASGYGIDNLRAELADGCSVADVNTTNRNPGDEGYGLPDGGVDGADLSYYIERWLDSNAEADVTTQNTNPGDAGYGEPDGFVDGADLSFYVEAWLLGCP